MAALMLAAALAVAAPACAYDKALLDLPAAEFDQDPKGGWRILDGKPGCETAAADLLAAYRAKHWGTLTSAELHINYWHEGQTRASGGDSARAIPLMLAGVNPDDVADFSDYALGSVAFLQHDRAALLAARSRLASLPEPEWFKTDMLAPGGMVKVKPAWPMNLNVLDGFINCFSKSYSEAYGAKCQQPVKR